MEELERRGTEVVVAFGQGDDPNRHRIPEGELSAPLPIRLLLAYRFLRRVEPDVIHSHGGLYYYLIAGYLYRLFHRTVLVYTFHTEPAEDRRISGVQRILLQALLDRCDHVTFVSERLRARVEEVLGLRLSNSRITYAGVRDRQVDESAAEAFRRSLGLEGKTIILLALGLTALRYKAEGLKVLMMAVKMAREKHPNLFLIATRRGRYLPMLEEFAESQGIKDAVLFTGDVEDPRIPLAACDIYTHISFGEGLPIALLEAMSMGKPIIASPAGGIPEAIEDGVNGLLVEPVPERIAEKVLYLLENREVAEGLGRNARRTVEERFTWDRAAKRFLDIYKGRSY